MHHDIDHYSFGESVLLRNGYEVTDAVGMDRLAFGEQVGQPCSNWFHIDRFNYFA